MNPQEIPHYLPTLALVIGALLGGVLGFCLGLEKLERERQTNQRRREAIRRHAVARGVSLEGNPTQPKKEKSK